MMHMFDSKFKDPCLYGRYYIYCTIQWDLVWQVGGKELLAKRFEQCQVTRRAQLFPSVREPHYLITWSVV
jgi:hypothetical protein